MASGLGAHPPPDPCSHLCQDVLALPGEQVLEPVKGEVVSQAQGRARGIAHVVRAVPLPVPTDTGNRMRGVRAGPLGVGTAGTPPTLQEASGSVGRVVCSLWIGPHRAPPSRTHTFLEHGAQEEREATLTPRHKAKKGPGWPR